MPESSVTSAENLAADYDKSIAAGQKFICLGWEHLSIASQKLLLSSGRWTERGQVRKDSDEHAWKENDRVEQLEYVLGTLNRCAAASLPYQRDDPNALVPSEALTDHVLHHCIELAADSAWHEPLFLRLSLRAICKNQMADLLTRLPVNKKQKDSLLSGFWAFLKVSGIFAGVAIGLVLFLASPLLLAFALATANKGDVASASIALYSLGLLWWIGWYGKIKAKGDDLSNDEKTYSAWLSFSFENHVIGEGALAYLKKMKRNGLNVPNVAFEVCAALRASMLTGQRQ